MNFKDAFILFLIIVIAVTLANLLTLYVAAKQVQGQLQGNSTLSLITGLLGGGTPAPATTST